MNLKHLELEILKESPFANCKLDRKKYADMLTSIIESYSDGFVLAINNKWGTGKTTFVKMWQQSLDNCNYQTIYFNAWENDFDDNPLIALMGELNNLRTQGKNSFKKVIKSAAKLSKNIAPSVVKAILNKYLDSEVLIEGLADGVKTGGEIFEEEIKEYVDKKKSITDFRRELSEFVGENTRGKPLIFIIDELDRCRPNYSVALLEQIKHFFSVKNIVFILSIDKDQLGNAVCGVYNSDRIDSDEYLRRFIDLEYSIPEPLEGEYFDYLYKYFDFDTFFESNERLIYNELKHDKSAFLATSKILLQKCNLRKLEKIMSTMRIILRTFNLNSYVIPVLYVFLIYIKFIHPQFYRDLIEKNLSLDIAHHRLFEIISPFINNYNKKYFVEIEGFILFFYNKSLFTNRGEQPVYEYNLQSGQYQLNIDSKINNKELLLFYNTHNRASCFYLELNFEYFIHKIELSDNFKIN